MSIATKKSHSLTEMELTNLANDLHCTSKKFMSISKVLSTIQHKDLAKHEVVALCEMMQENIELWADLTSKSAENVDIMIDTHFIS